MAQKIDNFLPGHVVAFTTNRGQREIGVNIGIVDHKSHLWDGWYSTSHYVIVDPVTCRGIRVNYTEIRPAGPLELLAFYERWDCLPRSTKMLRILEGFVRRYLVGYKKENRALA